MSCVVNEIFDSNFTSTPNLGTCYDRSHYSEWISYDRKSKPKANKEIIAEYCEVAITDSPNKGLYMWEEVHNSIIDHNVVFAGVNDMKVSRWYAINLAVAAIIFFVVLTSVSGMYLFFLDAGLSGKAISFTGFVCGISSLLFVWYNVFLKGMVNEP